MNRECRIAGGSDLGRGWIPVGVIRPSNAIANAFNAGFHLIAHRARPLPVGSSERVTWQVRRRDDPAEKRAAPLELFYDLVFVFALSQVSHLLLTQLTWAGAGRATLILLAVWWSWNYTTWATNELDPETNRVRILLIALMLASLLMAIAAPDAFGSKGLLFAGAYVSIQVGRHVFLTFGVAAKGTLERERAGRILIWFIAAGVFWIIGGLMNDVARVGLWLVALALDYGAPLVLFRLPGLPRPAGEA